MYIYIYILKIILHLGSCVKKSSCFTQPTNQPKILWFLFGNRIFPNQHETTKRDKVQLKGKKKAISFFFRLKTIFFWLVVSTHLKNISQIRNLPQIGLKRKNMWNHHPVFQQSPNPIQPDVVFEFPRNEDGELIVSVRGDLPAPTGKGGNRFSPAVLAQGWPRIQL